HALLGGPGGGGYAGVGVSVVALIAVMLLQAATGRPAASHLLPFCSHAPPSNAMPPLKMVHEYTEGTLILDVLDAATKSLVWRGTAQAEALPSVDVSTPQARIREAVRRILERFPPKA